MFTEIKIFLLSRFSFMEKVEDVEECEDCEKAANKKYGDITMTEKFDDFTEREPAE
jgi:hypothetical protein